MRAVLLLLPLLLLFFPVIFATEKGDCTRDGEVSSADALAALKMATDEFEQDLECADMNEDGRVTSYDASEILLLALVEEDSCGVLVERVRGILEGVSVEGFSGILAGSQRILVQVSNSKQCNFGIVVEGGRVSLVGEEEIENPTIVAGLSHETLDRLLQRGSLEELKKAVESGEIKVKARGVLSRLRVGIAKFALGLF